MEFALLGPLEARRDGDVLALGGPKQRAVLAMLLLRPNEVVSRDRLIEGLWGEAPPDSASRSLDSYVSRLRTLLGSDRIERRAPGYAIRADPDELDVERFRALVDRGRGEARSGAAAAAAATLREALTLWRGAALADLLYEPFASVEAERLEEERALATEDRIDADLDVGLDAELVPELERAVRDHPFRERTLAQLMLALYRSGRQSDALAAYQSGRRRLRDELGIEPGPELQELQRGILEHDSALARRPGSGPGVARDRPRRRRLSTAGVAAAVVAIGVAIGILLGTGGSNASSSAVSTNEVVRVGPGGSAHVRLEGTPAAMVAFEGSLWVADPDAQTLGRIDLERDGVVDRIPVPSPGALSAGAGAVWVASVTGETVFRVDPETGSVTQTIPLGRAHAAALAFQSGSVWIGDTTSNSLLELDPRSGTIVRTVPLDRSPSVLAAGPGTIWAADYDTGAAVEVDARTGRAITNVAVGNGPVSLAVGPGTVWVANGLDSTVSEIDAETGTVVSTIPVGSGPTAVSVSGDSVWVASEYAETVSRIDPDESSVIETEHLGGGPTALAVADGEIWAGVRPLVAHRGGTLTLLHTRPITIDPALHGDILPPVSDGLTRDGLVTYAQVAGPAGTRLIPDLALGIPVPTNSGRTYTFRLRPGIVYSDGSPLRAGDFRRALERVFNLRSYGTSYFESVVGAEECLAAGPPCRLSQGVVTDERTRTVTFHLSAADPAFLTNLTNAGLATPVPEGTPMASSPPQPIPGTGPYMIASASDEAIHYVRNPRFREWSHAAKPDGNPDEIVMRFDLSPRQAVRAIEAGRADWITEAVPPKLLPDLSRRFARQLRSHSAPIAAFYRLNTTLPPFDDVRVRQALNYAVDRGAILRIAGGLSAATVSCQVLPPGVRGHRPYCPYTRNPRGNGLWSAPDLAQARRLVAESGTAGASVSVWGATDDPAVSPGVSRIVADALRKIGYAVRLCLASADLSQIPAGCDQSRIQLGQAAWGDPFAYGYFGPWIACDGNQNTGFCDRHLDARMRHALALEASDPRAAASEWERIDRDVTDRAVWVSLLNPRVVDFVSARVRNYQYHPFWGMLASQIWVS